MTAPEQPAAPPSPAHSLALRLQLASEAAEREGWSGTAYQLHDLAGQFRAPDTDADQVATAILAVLLPAGAVPDTPGEPKGYEAFYRRIGAVPAPMTTPPVAGSVPDTGRPAGAPARYCEACTHEVGSWHDEDGFCLIAGCPCDAVEVPAAASPSPDTGQVARHFMLPGSHERPGGAECRCGEPWSRWDDTCRAQLLAAGACPHEGGCLHKRKPGAADCGNHERSE